MRPRPDIHAGSDPDGSAVSQRALLAFFRSVRTIGRFQIRITCDTKGFEAKALFDSSKSRLLPFPSTPEKRPICVRLDYGRPSTVHSITLSSRVNHKALIIATQVPTSWEDDAYGQGMSPIPPLGRLEASDDGTTWRAVCQLPGLGV